jgi:hypothetical protein
MCVERPAGRKDFTPTTTTTREEEECEASKRVEENTSQPRLRVGEIVRVDEANE